jgi:hypothetical protein
MQTSAPALYALLVERALLHQVIADRRAQLAALPRRDNRRLPVIRELFRLSYAQMRLNRLFRKAQQQKGE